MPRKGSYAGRPNLSKIGHQILCEGMQDRGIEYKIYSFFCDTTTFVSVYGILSFLEYVVLLLVASNYTSVKEDVKTADIKHQLKYHT